MIGLLYVNLRFVVIGASLECYISNCDFTSDHFLLDLWAGRYDRADHSINGGLLFASKALEVWFQFVAGLLVYEVSMILAQRTDGLPTGYLLTYMEFGDIRNLLNPLLWTSPICQRSWTGMDQLKSSRLFLFAILAAYLTILVNLMGPATGVLIQPTIQSISDPPISQVQHLSLHSEKAPTKLLGCSGTQLETNNYSCAERIHGPQLDSVISFSAGATRSNYLQYANLTTAMPVVEESLLQFLLYNFSTSAVKNAAQDPTLWCPNRQAVRKFSNDLNNIKNRTEVSITVLLIETY